MKYTTDLISTHRVFANRHNDSCLVYSTETVKRAHRAQPYPPSSMSIAYRTTVVALADYIQSSGFTHDGMPAILLANMARFFEKNKEHGKVIKAFDTIGKKPGLRSFVHDHQHVFTVSRSDRGPILVVTGPLHGYRDEEDKEEGYNDDAYKDEEYADCGYEKYGDGKYRGLKAGRQESRRERDAYVTVTARGGRRKISTDELETFLKVLEALTSVLR